MTGYVQRTCHKEEKKNKHTNPTLKTKKPSLFKKTILIITTIATFFGGYLLVDDIFFKKTPPNYRTYIVYDVVLTSTGPNKIATIKAIRNITGKGLKESKKMVESLPTTLKKSISQKESIIIKKDLLKIGVSYKLIPTRVRSKRVH